MQTRHLEEVVVQADRSHMTLEKTTFIPTRRQKDASASGSMLLHQLAIPQLQVDPLTGSVTTSGGEAVSWFINSIPASAAEVAGINTRDVKRVEVFDYPADPKFRGAAHVVNFVTHKYEYGGYTKLNTTENLLNGVSSSNVVNTKMAYKRMMYDARATYSYTNSSHSGADYAQTFTLPFYTDAIERKSRYLDSKQISNGYGASFRALYDSDKTQVSSTLNWSLTDRFRNRSASSITYTPSILPAATFTSHNPARSNNFSWMNTFLQLLPRQWSLSGGAYLYYSDRDRRQSRHEGDVTIRDLRIGERAINTEAHIMASKRLSSSHLLGLELTGKVYTSRVDYTGSVASRFERVQSLVAPGATYTYTSPTGRFVTSLNAVGSLYHSRSDDVTETIFFPNITIQAQWMPVQKHRFSLIGTYAIEPATGAQANPVLLQSDMLSWTRGNPHLRSANNIFAQAGYLWMATPTISLQAIATWSHKGRYIADRYFLSDDGSAIVSMPDNCGNHDNIWASLNVSAYALHNSLVLQAMPTVTRHRFTGVYDIASTSFFATLKATYYYKQFYLGISYTTPRRLYNAGNPVHYKHLSQYWLTAGWGNASWNVQAYIVNPFRTSWHSDITELHSPHYSFVNTAIDTDSHLRLNIAVTYTFGYGKKIGRGNELQESTYTDSSIR